LACAAVRAVAELVAKAALIMVGCTRVELVPNQYLVEVPQCQQRVFSKGSVSSYVPLTSIADHARVELVHGS
jgi:hypothetical protein